jgi:tryptophanase
MYKTRIVQKTTLPSIRQRLRAIEAGGYNTFLLRTRDIFIDMLTDSGTISMDRDAAGNDVPADVELCRMAVPRRVYTMSHIDYVVDRLDWLLHNRQLVGGLEFYSEPPVLRFFTGKLKALDNRGSRLADAFASEFGENY